MLSDATCRHFSGVKLRLLNKYLPLPNVFLGLTSSLFSVRVPVVTWVKQKSVGLFSATVWLTCVADAESERENRSGYMSLISQCTFIYIALYSNLQVATVLCINEGS